MKNVQVKKSNNSFEETCYDMSTSKSTIIVKMKTCEQATIYLRKHATTRVKEKTQ